MALLLLKKTWKSEALAKYLAHVKRVWAQLKVAELERDSDLLDSVRWAAQALIKTAPGKGPIR